MIPRSILSIPYIRKALGLDANGDRISDRAALADAATPGSALEAAIAAAGGRQYMIDPRDFAVFSESPDNIASAWAEAITDAQTENVAVHIGRAYNFATNKLSGATKISGGVRIIGEGRRANSALHFQNTADPCIEIETGASWAGVELSNFIINCDTPANLGSHSLSYGNTHRVIKIHDPSGTTYNRDLVIQRLWIDGGYAQLEIDNQARALIQGNYFAYYCQSGLLGKRTDGVYDAGDHWCDNNGYISLPSSDPRFVSAGAGAWITGGSGWKFYKEKMWPYHARGIMWYLHNTDVGDGLANSIGMVHDCNFDSQSYTLPDTAWVEVDSAYGTTAINGNRLAPLTIIGNHGGNGDWILKHTGPAASLYSVYMGSNQIAGGGGFFRGVGATSGVTDLVIIGNVANEAQAGQTKYIQTDNTAGYAGAIIKGNVASAADFPGGSDLPTQDPNLAPAAVTASGAVEAITVAITETKIRHHHIVTLTRTDHTLTIGDGSLADGMSGVIRLWQDATGSRLVTTWAVPSGFTLKWIGGSAPTLATTAEDNDLVEWRVVGTLVIARHVGSIGVVTHPPTPLADTFTDTNGTLLSAHAADSGHTWTVSGTLDIQNNKAVGQTAAISAGYVDMGAGGADATIIVTVADASGDSGVMDHGVLFNYVDADNYWRFVCGNNYNWLLIERTAGVETTRGSYAAVPSWKATPTSYEMKVVSNGDDVTCYLDGTSRITYNASGRNHKTSAKHGIYKGALNSLAYGQFDSITATPIG